MSETPETVPERVDIEVDQVRCVRLGSGANCSSIGSVVDTLFASAAAGAAILAAVAAALRTEPVKVAGRRADAERTRRENAK
jgi:hypothetical protein